MVEKDARTVIRIVNIEKMRMKRTVPIWINNMHDETEEVDDGELGAYVEDEDNEVEL